MSRVRWEIGRLAKACHHAIGFNGRAVEPEVWRLLDLPDSEIPAALHALNLRFREMPGFPGLSLGTLPAYHVYSFQQPAVVK